MSQLASQNKSLLSQPEKTRKQSALLRARADQKTVTGARILPVRMLLSARKNSHPCRPEPASRISLLPESRPEKEARPKEESPDLHVSVARIHPRWLRPVRPVLQPCRSAEFPVLLNSTRLKTGKQLLSKKTDHKKSQDQRAVLAFLNEESGRVNRFCCYDTNSWQEAKAAGLSCLFCVFCSLAGLSCRIIYEQRSGLSGSERPGRPGSKDQCRPGCRYHRAGHRGFHRSGRR